MNIIEKLGIEKCREIVAGAPRIAEFYVLVFFDSASAYYFMGDGFVFSCTDGGVYEIANSYASFDEMTSSWGDLHGVCASDIACGHIEDIKQAIADHEQAEMINYSPNVRVLK